MPVDIVPIGENVAHRKPPIVWNKRIIGNEIIVRAALNVGASMGYMQAVSSTIAGGTTEIQKGIIATRGLGLPRG